MPRPTPRAGISFEFFPPQSLEASFRLWDCVRDLAPLDPTFVSVTYGAGGTTRKLTHEAVETIHKNWGLNVAAHLTCVNATRAETLAIVDQYRAAGVTEIVALRGDPPKGQGAFTPAPDGFQNSVELIEALAAPGDLKLRVGAYPDPHPEASGPGADVAYLKRKIEAGGHSAITQFFFEADTFLRFRDACAAAGITAEIVPGILPIQGWRGVTKFAERCGTPVPAGLNAQFDAAIAEGREQEFATQHCVALCETLLSEGARNLHFYTLNKPGMTRDVVTALGLAPEGPASEVA